MVLALVRIISYFGVLTQGSTTARFWTNFRYILGYESTVYFHFLNIQFTLSYTRYFNLHTHIIYFPGFENTLTSSGLLKLLNEKCCHITLTAQHAVWRYILFQQCQCYIQGHDFLRLGRLLWQQHPILPLRFW